MNYAFLPNGERAAHLDLSMRQSLADSLSYLFQQLSNDFTFDQPQANRLIETLQKGENYSALLFALYTQLVMQLTDENYEEVERILALMIQQKPLEKGQPEFVRLDHSSFGGQGHLLAELMNVEGTGKAQIQSPEDGSDAVFAQRLQSSLSLISQALPDFSQEVTAIISQVIMVEPVAGSELMFDGGSSYMLWGGLFLNVHAHGGQAQLIEVLAHESAHVLLFGFAANEPLCLNPPEATYSSPLRCDPRPMEGVYHATYVSARMFWAMKTLLDADVLDEDGQAYAKEAIPRNLEAFYSGYLVVEEYGQLSGTGQGLMAACLDYMKPYLEQAGKI